MKTTTETKHRWTCPKCGRQFERQGQAHSCRPYPILQHFKNKPAGRLLYEKFIRAVKKQGVSFKIESLECCIHLVSGFTFAAVKILRDKIRVDFALTHNISGARIKKSFQMSAHRFLCVLDIINEDEINDELLNWIKEASEKRSIAKGVA